MDPTAIGRPGSLSLGEAAAVEIRRCEVRARCGDDGAVLRLEASLAAGACCCCRGRCTLEHDAMPLIVGP
jgi:hypothetical protein